jgi:uncharacterized protein (DUF433 family)
LLKRPHGLAEDTAIARKQTFRLSGDIRDYPRYSIEEAAHHLNIPISTLSAWVRGYKRKDKSGRVCTYGGVLTLADPKRGLLSFFNLAEAYVLRFARGRDVPLNRVRLAMEYIREHSSHEHPLLRRDFATRGKSVFIRELGIPLNASKHGQFGIEAILKEHLKGIKRGPDGLPDEIHPLLNKRISINPLFSSGEPVVTGTGIMVSILVSRTGAGDNPDEIASDYGLDRNTIEQAVKAFKRPKAA